MNNDAKVKLWGSTIGAVTWVEDREVGVFQYDPDFLASNIQLAPLMMPLKPYPYEFSALPRNTFRGLPGLLVDSLPDRFGNAIIDAWLASTGRTTASFHPVERLCYTGVRGMGALEFEPATFSPPKGKSSIDVASLVNLANKILDQRASLGGVFTGYDDRKAIEDILRVGTSAGGARAKAILAWNPNTNEFRSGQINIDKGFEHWLMKFDGVKDNNSMELQIPLGYGKIEYAYHLMAIEAGIKMTSCRLHKEGGRSHFMTKRFDRTNSGNKLHMQSLGAIAHYDYNQSDAYSYEQAIKVIKRLKLSHEDVKQQVIRTIFNIVCRNHDDHVKNIAFIMNRKGVWSLSPAYDISYSWDPNGKWTHQHQMSVNGKRTDIKRSDIVEYADFSGIKKFQANEMIDKVVETAKNWPDIAHEAGISDNRISEINNHLLLYI